jgi:hypothetical protein
MTMGRAELLIQRVNDTIASYHAKRRGEEGIPLEEAVESIKRHGYTEDEARRFLNPVEHRRR